MSRIKLLILVECILVLCCQKALARDHALEQILETIHSKNNVYEPLRTLKETIMEEEMEEADNPESLGEWYLENVFDANQDLSSISVQAVTVTASRDLYWEPYLTRDDWKKGPLYDPTPTLATFKYLILPIWWSDQDENDPSLQMNIGVDKLDQTREFYDQMSWNQFTLSYEILPQQKFTISSVNPGFGETHDAAYTLLEGMGYVEGDGSFDGVMLIYYVAQAGPFSGHGGWGHVNGPFIWMSYNPDINYKVTRHEVGHNLGHPHHRSMLGYRKNPTCECGYYDGFDMMSGGNGYAISHFPLAGKWFFNWVPDSTIIMMQPEGTTDQCPDCSKEGTFQIFTFDNSDASPQADQIMGIQIPIMGENSRRFYSYWLSYRSGNDGDAAGGLSVHLGWFNLGGMFGASYDSLNYDAHGNTETTFDSFVLPGTCYIIEPALKLMDIDPFSAKQVIPQVCVDSLNIGSDITVSVSFLDPSELYSSSSRANKPDQELICSVDGQAAVTQIVSPNSLSLIHITGAGSNGVITSNLCSSTVTGYIYDNYPYATLDAGAPLAYGSFPGFNDNICSAQTKFGEAWLLLESNDTIEAKIEIGCQVKSCFQNQYLSNNICTQCPDNHIAPAGSTDISACTKCTDGAILKDPLAPGCQISDEFDPNIETANGWRVWAPSTHTSVGWAVDIRNIKMYSTSDCSGTEISIDGTFVESGNAGLGWGPENAFKESGTWGGRPDENRNFWVGVMFSNDGIIVRCLKIDFADKHMTELRIQASIEKEWKNVWIERNVSVGVTNVGWEPLKDLVPSTAPSVLPTMEPAPSVAPSLRPSKIPPAPSAAPSTRPTSFPSVSRSPTKSPTAKPVKSKPTRPPKTTDPPVIQPTKPPKNDSKPTRPPKNKIGIDCFQNFLRSIFAPP